MRCYWRGLFLGFGMALFLGGCSREQTIKPPANQPEFALPPDDPRYSRYPQYPEKTLNSWNKKDPTSDTTGPASGFPKQPGRMAP